MRLPVTRETDKREKREKEQSRDAGQQPDGSVTGVSLAESTTRAPIMAVAGHEPSNVGDGNSPYLTSFPKRTRDGWFKSDDPDLTVTCKPLAGVNVYLYGSTNCRIVGTRGNYEWTFRIFTTGKWTPAPSASFGVLGVSWESTRVYVQISAMYAPVCPDK